MLHYNWYSLTSYRHEKNVWRKLKWNLEKFEIWLVSAITTKIVPKINEINFGIPSESFTNGVNENTTKGITKNCILNLFIVFVICYSLV